MRSIAAELGGLEGALSRAGAFRTVLKPLPRYLAHAIAFVARHDLLGLIELEWPA